MSEKCEFFGPNGSCEENAMCDRCRDTIAALRARVRELEGAARKSIIAATRVQFVHGYNELLDESVRETRAALAGGGKGEDRGGL